ncbi:MAG: hypothetical protein GY861_01005 [bacterium]|nr:hypothetical protein [bacterium]
MAFSNDLQRTLARFLTTAEISTLQSEILTLVATAGYATVAASAVVTSSRENNIAGLSSAITLANECKLDFDTHIASGGAGISSAITLANDCKAMYNAHCADGGTGLATAIALANAFKATYNSHCGSTAEHASADAVNTTAAADATNLATLITLITELLTDYDAHEGDSEGGGALAYHHVAEGGDASLASAVAPANLAECITRVNDLKAKFNTHDADAIPHTAGSQFQEATADGAVGTGEHPAAPDATNTTSAADATDLATLITLVTELLTDFDAHEGDAELASAWLFHEAQEGGNTSLASTAAPTTYAECITRLNDFKTKLNAHDADATSHDTGTTHQVTAANAAVGAGEHPAGADTARAIVAADATNLTTLIALTTELLTSYDAHEGDAELAALWLYHEAGEGGDASLTSTAAPTTLALCVTRLNDWKAKFNTHDADATAHDTGSTAQITSSDAAYGATNRKVVSGVLATDDVTWAILDSGTGTVVGVGATPGAGFIDFEFDADPEDDCVYTYTVTR